jgi:hypothetical protein
MFGLAIRLELRILLRIMDCQTQRTLQRWRTLYLIYRLECHIRQKWVWPVLILWAPTQCHCEKWNTKYTIPISKPPVHYIQFKSLHKRTKTETAVLHKGEEINLWICGRTFRLHPNFSCVLTFKFNFKRLGGNGPLYCSSKQQRQSSWYVPL